MKHLITVQEHSNVVHYNIECKMDIDSYKRHMT